jgi:hypothetical protein
MNIIPLINSGIRPKVPTRDQILNYKASMQGVTLRTPSYGILPFWETIAWFPNKVDRAAAYQVKHNRRDTHAIMDISGSYREPGQIYDWLDLGIDYTQNDQSLTLFANLCKEVISNGFYVDVRLAGDGQSINSNPSYGQYNDPVGDTYGFQWLVNNFERIANHFSDIYKYCIFTPGYDDIFYGWSPEQVVQFGKLFRSIFPDGNLGIEFNTGHIPLGEGNDYTPGGRMQDYDILFGEFDGWIGSYNLADRDNTGGYKGDQIWQIVGRLSYPYIWPADEPKDADKNPPPFLLSSPNPRGPFVFNVFEYDTYRWVRNQVTQQQIFEEQQYFKALGCKYVC